METRSNYTEIPHTRTIFQPDSIDKRAALDSLFLNTKLLLANRSITVRTDLQGECPDSKGSD